MKIIKTCFLAVMVFAVLVDSSFSSERYTIFTDNSFSSVQQMAQQYAEQKQLMFKTIQRADAGESSDRFGTGTEALQMGLFLLEPDLATVSSTHAIAVIRNNTPDTVKYYGNPDDIFKFYAIGDNKQILDRTSKGEYYGGGAISLVNSGVAFYSIPSGGQVVYEFNLASFFNLTAGKPVYLTAEVTPKDSRFRVLQELRSEVVSVTPKEKSTKESLFDGPHLPAEYMKYVTNRSANIAPQAASSAPVTAPVNSPVVVSPEVPVKVASSVSKPSFYKAPTQLASTEAPPLAVVTPASEPASPVSLFLKLAGMAGAVILFILVRAAGRAAGTTSGK